MLVAVLLAAGIVIALLVAAFEHVVVTRRDIAWLAGTAAFADDEGEVYARCLRRHRRHRSVGGTVGVALAVVVGIRFADGVTVGIGRAGPLGDILFAGLAGVVAGALSAETYRLREPRSTVVAASLAARAVTEPRAVVLAARGLVTVAGVVAIAAELLGTGSWSVAIAAAGLVPAVLAEATRAAVLGRRRPVLSDRAAVVDLRLRAFALASVARLQLAAALLAAGWTLTAIGPPRPIAFAGGLAAVVGAAVLARRGAPRPPRGWAPA